MRRQQSVINSFQDEFHQSQPRVRFVVNQKQPKESSQLNRSLLLKSQNLSQKYKYVKYDMHGNTQLINEPKQVEQGFSYQKVHMQEDSNSILGQSIKWKKDIQKLTTSISSKQKIVLRPLRKLYEKNYRPEFFEWIQQTKSSAFQYYSNQVPQCLYELDHLSPNHTRFLFLNQGYSQNGIYQVIVNEDGRFRLVTVNDLVPVTDESNQHIWKVQQPWKMILLKVWACLNQGYDNMLKDNQPFHFLEYFTSNNWKYFNLEREGIKWINKFKDILDICYIVLQTKNSQTVQQMGLVPNTTFYNVVQITNDPQRGIQIEVKSRFKHKWKGQLSMINYNKKLQKKTNKQFGLEKNFLLTKDQFLQMFCCAYVISLSKSNTHITDYCKIDISANTKKAVFLKFSVKKEGFMDFSFIQSYKNKIPFQSNQSKIDVEKYHKQISKKDPPKSRFLKCKYMLIKCLRGSTKPFESKLSTLRTSKQPELTSSAKYEAYEVEYLRGYNKGEGHFMMMEPGDYYFRLKSESVNKDAVYYLNYCCSEKLDISQEIILGEERQDILQNCILSLLPASSQIRNKSSCIYSGNKFDDMGYGFIVVENISHKQKYPKDILFEINTRQLQIEGYKLKGSKYKNTQQTILLEIKPKNHGVLIFKKIQDNPNRNYVWPPKSVCIFKTQGLHLSK